MLQNNQNDSLIQLKRLSANDDYYNIVFKKTERVASAVFYMLAHIDLNDRTKIHHNNLSDTAMKLHQAVIESLNWYEFEVQEKIHMLIQALVVVESSLRLATSAKLLSSDMEQVVVEEIDSVIRYTRNHYLNSAAPKVSISPTAPKTKMSPAIKRRTRPNIPQNDFSSDAVLVYSDLSDRTARIKTVLDAKPEATIKDLSEIITDVSTKTIQRDLNSLIESGEVIRQGERRWSKYSINK